MDINELAKLVEPSRLLKLLLPYQWQHNCEIIPDYRPFSYKNSRTMVLIRASNRELCYSRGPRGGFIWGNYGDDFKTIELALLALSKASPPGTPTLLEGK